MEYELELLKVIKEINKNKAKVVCIQLPDGLKPKATEITKEIEANTDAMAIIWLESCFGSCDVPNIDVDMLVQFGHTKWAK